MAQSLPNKKEDLYFSLPSNENPVAVATEYFRGKRGEILEGIGHSFNCNFTYVHKREKCKYVVVLKNFFFSRAKLDLQSCVQEDPEAWEEV